MNTGVVENDGWILLLAAAGPVAMHCSLRGSDVVRSVAIIGASGRVILVLSPAMLLEKLRKEIYGRYRMLALEVSTGGWA